MHVWDGECHVHAGIRPADINAIRASEPGADLLVHPGVRVHDAGDGVRRRPATSRPQGTHFLSTEGMMRFAREADRRRTMIVATETGILHRMEQENPGKTFIPANGAAVCRYMKMITLPELRDALRDMKPEVKVPPESPKRARFPIDRMVAIG